MPTLKVLNKTSAHLQGIFTKNLPLLNNGFRLVALIFFAALLLFQKQVACGALPAHKWVQTEYDTLKNPFPFSMTGMPFITNSCGYGEPKRIPPNELLNVIDSIFKVEDLNMQKILFKTDSGYVQVNAYDSVQKIGYVWLYWDNVDNDLWIDYRDYDKTLEGDYIKTSHLRRVDEYLQYNQKSIKKIYDSFLAYKSDSSELKTLFILKMKQLLDAGETQWNDQNKWLYYDYYIKVWQAGENANRISLKMKRYLKRTLNIRNNKRRHQRIETSLDILETNSYAPFIQIGDALVRAAKSKNSRQNLERISLIIRAFYQFNKTDPTRSELLKKGITKGKDDWKPAATLAAQWLDEVKISRGEVLALQKAAEEGRYFIAPISYRDERLIYKSFASDVDNQVLDMRNRFQNFDTVDDDSLELEKHIEFIRKANGITKEDALEMFQQVVHNYILWAKQQRGY